MNPDFLELKFSRTLWQGVYRAKLMDPNGFEVASLRVVPCLPISAEELPPNDPEVGPDLLVTVDLAEIDPKEFLEWENSLALKILTQFSHQEPIPRECQFFYPSPLELHSIDEDREKTAER